MLSVRSHLSATIKRLTSDDLYFNQVFIRAYSYLITSAIGSDWLASRFIFKDAWTLVSYPSLLTLAFIFSAASLVATRFKYYVLAGFLLVFVTLGGSISLILIAGFSDELALPGVMITVIIASQILPRPAVWFVALLSWGTYSAAYIIKSYPAVISSLISKGFGAGLVLALLSLVMYLIRLLRDERMLALSTANRNLVDAVKSTNEAIQLKMETEARQAKLVAGLRAVIVVTDELMAIPNVQTLYRRAVELAREKLNVERCAIFVEENDEQMRGTYGTDSQGHTTNEGSILIPKSDALLEALAKIAPDEQQWITKNEEQTEWDGDHIRKVGTGWISVSRIHSNNKTIGAFFNDAAISHTAMDKTQQEVITVFCSMLGKIVERKQMEQSLAHSEERYRRFFNEIADTVLIHDLQGQILDVNEAATEHLGYTRTELLKMNTRDIDQEDFANGFSGRLQQQISSGKMSHIQGTHKTRDGQLIDIDINSIVVNYDGQRAVLAVCRDITEQKLVERELRNLNQLKTEFLSTAAHELRTPLVSIVGFSEILLTRDLDSSRLKHFIHVIHEQSVSLGRIIDSLLDISRLEAKQVLALDLQPVNLAALVTKVLTYFAEYRPKYQFEIDGLDTCPSIQGDSFRLTQVFQNLFSNAIKFSPNGGLIMVHGQSISDYIQISVQDDGIGMTSQQQEHLFERFYRADSSNTTISGTGLGLAICKLIIELHGGQIWAESEYHVGTTIYFRLPLSISSRSQDDFNLAQK